MKLHRFLFVFFFIGAITPSVAQENPWSYRRKVTGISADGWYSITLPPDIFKHTSPSFDDLRILSIETDTTEVPYVLNVKASQYESENVSLPIMNESRKNGIYYVTFINSKKIINQLFLEFEEKNYFATVALQGSQNNRQWFDITEGQKIFSVHNAFEDYEYSELHFPSSEYDYFRIAVTSQAALHLVRASFKLHREKPGTYAEVRHQWKVIQDKRARQTIVNVRLDHFQPISKITLDIPSENDYYRSARVEVVADSFKTEKGWRKNYVEVYSGHLTSIHPNEISFRNTLAGGLRIIINNLDNPPLTIEHLRIEGAVVELISNLPASKDIFLYYGNDTAYKPSYDLEHFREKIPSTPDRARLGSEERLTTPPAKVTAFFENKALLYTLMIVVIAVLGFFTLRMMKAKPNV